MVPDSSFHHNRQFTTATTLTTTLIKQATNDKEEEVTTDTQDEKLYEIAKRLKLEIFDLDEGIFGFESQDNAYALEVIHTSITLDAKTGALGLVLTEMAGNVDGRGLVLVSDVTGPAQKAHPAAIQVGDVITGIRTTDGSVRERTTGLNYDRTVEAIGTVKEAALAKDGEMYLEIDRLVARSPLTVEVVQADGSVLAIDALAGENLRRLLLRKSVKIYNQNTKRFDMPYATGDCAGEGLCGTCLVAVQQGADLLSPKQGVEELITRGRPLSWRASCRTIIGPNNEGGKIRIRVQPQTNMEDELNPGVKPLNMEE
jgi:ferredoxin